MSSYGMTLTLLATNLYEAARKDENLKLDVDQYTATFGPAVSEWLEGVAKIVDSAKHLPPPQ